MKYSETRLRGTHEPVNLSIKTLRAKSSIEYAILSKIVEQSGSVANSFSLSDISVSAATKNIRRSANSAGQWYDIY